MEKNNYIYNKKMINRISKLKSFNGEIIGNPERIWPNFYEEKGFILTGEKTFSDEDVDRILKRFYSRTWYEYNFSEFDIIDSFKVKDNTEAISIAFWLAKIWEVKLRFLFPNYDFRIVISSGEDFVNIRYYRFREEEMIDLTKIDDFENEVAVVMINHNNNHV